MHYIQGKGWFEVGGNKVGSMRQINLWQARSAGYHNDSSEFMKLRVESRVSYDKLLEEWHKGRRMKEKAETLT